MLKLLRAFEPYRPLLPKKHGAQLKSGTMTGVYCYTGYLDTQHGTVLFAVLLNPPKNEEDLQHTVRLVPLELPKATPTVQEVIDETEPIKEKRKRKTKRKRKSKRKLKVE